jgi:hypothetical protein
VTPNRLLLLLLCPLAAACDNTISGPTGTDSSAAAASTIAPSTESFEATLSAGGSTFYSFTVGTAGSVAVTLASVVQVGRPAALTTPMRIGLGTPAGEGCTTSDTVDAAAALQPQLTVSQSAGIHCVSIADAGQLTAPAVVSIRFTHP